jgi:hypothetical protein
MQLALEPLTAKTMITDGVSDYLLGLAWLVRGSIDSATPPALEKAGGASFTTENSLSSENYGLLGVPPQVNPTPILPT